MKTLVSLPWDLFSFSIKYAGPNRNSHCLVWGVGKEFPTHTASRPKGWLVRQGGPL